MRAQPDTTRFGRPRGADTTAFFSSLLRGVRFPDGAVGIIVEKPHKTPEGVKVVDVLGVDPTPRGLEYIVAYERERAERKFMKKNRMGAVPPAHMAPPPYPGPLPATTTNGPMSRLAALLSSAKQTTTGAPFSQEDATRHAILSAHSTHHRCATTVADAVTRTHQAKLREQQQLQALTQGPRLAALTDVLGSGLTSDSRPSQDGAFKFLKPKTNRIFHLLLILIALALITVISVVDRLKDKFITHVYFSAAKHSAVSDSHICLDTHNTWAVDPVIFSVILPSLITLFSAYYAFNPYYMSNNAGDSSNWLRWLQVALVGGTTVALACLFCGIGDLGYILLLSLLYTTQPLINYVLEWTHMHRNIQVSSFGRMKPSEWLLFAVTRLPSLVVITLLCVAVAMNSGRNPDLPKFTTAGVSLAIVLLACMDILVFLFVLQRGVFRAYINVNFFTNAIMMLLATAFALTVVIGGAASPGDWFSSLV